MAILGGLFGQGPSTGQGILGGFNDYAKNNSQALLAAGGSLLSGNGWGGGALAYGAGAQLDTRNREAAQDQQRQALFDQQRTTLFDQGQEERKAAIAQGNATKQWFAKNAPGYEDAPSEVQKAVVLSLFQKQKPTDDIQEYEYAKNQGFTGTFNDYQTRLKKSGATNVTVGGGRYGTIPQGFELIEGPQGASMRPIPGGPADIDKQAAANAASIKKESTARSGNVVLQDIDRALEGLDKGVLPTAGAIGGALSNLPGTQAYDVGSLIQTIKANSGFDRLQAMRDSSPTGGALGAINQSEMGLLQSALGNLEQSQSPEQLKFNLERVKKIYDEIVNGPASQRSQPSGTTTRRRYNPQTGEIE